MEMPVDLAFLPALPEIVLAVGVLILLMVGAFGGNRAVPIVTALAIALIVFAALGRLFMPTAGVAFDGAFVSDPFARFMKLLVLIGSGVAIVMSIG
jgi:NADH-quinone oxidoreductase subunit N